MEKARDIINFGFGKYFLFFFILFTLSACNGSPVIPTATMPPSPTPISAAEQDILLKELTQAIRDHKVEEIQRILQAGVDVNVIQPSLQITPLSLASREGDTAVVTLLLDHGADIGMYNKNQYGTTALIEAALKGYADVVKLLLERGADINQRDQAGDPALNWATYYGHIEVVQVLIENKAKLTVVGSGGGTALNTAIARGHKDIEKLLRDAGATR